MKTISYIVTVTAVLAAAAPAAAERPRLTPYATVVGGLGVEDLQPREGDDSEDRTTTIALSRFGLRGVLSRGVYVESEFEVNAGPHGTSAWEGQAALQVRNQLLRIERWGARLEVGRITDDSSVDFFSAHVADQLMTDPFTRLPLLSSGFNRGNGILLRYQVLPGLEPGVSLNSANPTSTTSSLVLGGSFPPFSRFYFAPYQQVGRDASSLPADQYQITVLTPSVVYRHRLVEARGGVQLFRVNTDTTTSDDQNILGYNLRGGVTVPLLGRRLRPFLDLSRVENSVVEADDGKVLSPDVFVGYTVTGGIDYDYSGHSGVGVQYTLLRAQQGRTNRQTSHFVNLGSTYWLTDSTSFSARVSIYRDCQLVAGEGPCDPEGERAYYATARAIF